MCVRNRSVNLAQVFRNDSAPSPPSPSPTKASAIIDGGAEQIISYWKRTTSRKSLFRDDTAGCGDSFSRVENPREEFVIFGITAGECWGRDLYRFSERISEKDNDKLRIGGPYYYAQYEFRSTSHTHDYILPNNLYF